MTNYVIHPFVGLIPAGLAWRLSEREVDAVLELPLKTLKESRTRKRLNAAGSRSRPMRIVVDEHLIWGATARILENLLERLPSERRYRSAGRWASWLGDDADIRAWLLPAVRVVLLGFIV